MPKSQNIIAIILLGFLLLILVSNSLDFWASENPAPIFYALYSVDSESIANSMGSLAEVITSLFGIIVTVVAIIVNLSANRYTQKIIDIFIKEKINVIILSLFSITSLYGIWIINSVRPGRYEESYVPQFQLLVYLLLIVVSILLIVPYFYYVFKFLRPHNIISKIKKQILHLFEKAKSSSKSAYIENYIKPTIIANIDQLSEICKSSVNNADRSLALLSLTTLNNISEYYIDVREAYLEEHPGELPFYEEWYQNIEIYFLGLNKPIIEELQNQKFWLEYKILEEFESIFLYSLEKDTKVSYQTAINLTKLSQRCIKYKDMALFRDIVRFFNSLLRISISKLDTQNTLYVFYQYYSSCELLIKNIEELYIDDPKALILSIAKYFKYYGQLGQEKNLDKVLEYSAYFLRLVNQKVYNRFKTEDVEFVKQLLTIFLTVDDISSHNAKEALLGVRQHQAILASHFMANPSDDGDLTSLLNQIYKDIDEESTERKAEIARSILEVNTNTYFEIDNLGINPIYIRRDYKEKLEEFFSRFKGVNI